MSRGVSVDVQSHDPAILPVTRGYGGQIGHGWGWLHGWGRGGRRGGWYVSEMESP